MKYLPFLLCCLLFQPACFGQLENVPTSLWSQLIKNETIRKEVDFTDSQARELDRILDDLVEKLQEQFQEELAQLKKKYQDKLNEALTKEQREKAKSALGECPPHIGKPIRF